MVHAVVQLEEHFYTDPAFFELFFRTFTLHSKAVTVHKWQHCFSQWPWPALESEWQSEPLSDCDHLVKLPLNLLGVRPTLLLQWLTRMTPHVYFNDLILYPCCSPWWPLSITDGGHPTLRQDDKSIQQAQNDNDRETRNSVLNAIAALLVQKHEIIAIVAQNLPESNFQSPSPVNETTEQAILCPATHEAVGTFSAKQLSRPFGAVTVLCNPEDLDCYFNNNSDDCILVDPGKSHIAITTSGKWIEILSLPWVILFYFIFQMPLFTCNNTEHKIHLRTTPPHYKTTYESSSPHRGKISRKLC